MYCSEHASFWEPPKGEVRRIYQPVEKLPLCPLRPQIESQTHRIWGFLELLEPDA